MDAIGYTSDGATLVTAETSGHGTFLVPRDPNTLDPSGSRVRAHDANVTGLAFSADGRWLVTTSQGSDETVLWDARTLRQVRSFDVAARDTPLDAAANDVAVSPDGAVAALIHNVADPERSEGDVSFLDLRAGDVQVGSGGHRGKGDTQWEATGVAFTPDGRSVVTTGNDSRVLVWDVASARVRETLGGSADVQIRGPAIPSDGTTVFTTDRAREVVVWDLAGDHRMDRPFVAGTGYAGWPWYAASPDGRTLAIMETDDWGRSGSVNLVDTASLTSMGRIRYPHSTPQGVDFGPDGRTLAVSSWNNDAAHARLWNPFAREPKGPDLPGVEAFPDAELCGQRSSARTAAPLQVGPRSGQAADAGVYLWNVASGASLPGISRLPAAVNDLAFTPDGEHLVAVTGLAEGGVIYWNLAADGVETTIHADDLGVWSTDVSDDGRLIVTGGKAVACRWNVAAGTAEGLPCRTRRRRRHRRHQPGWAHRHRCEQRWRDPDVGPRDRGDPWRTLSRTGPERLARCVIHSRRKPDDRCF